MRVYCISRLRIVRQEGLVAHLKREASWKGSIIRKLLDRFQVHRGTVYFWGTSPACKMPTAKDGHAAISPLGGDEWLQVVGRG